MDFRNAESLDSGKVARRHIVVDGVEFIGKEADRWEERLHLSVGQDDHIAYPQPREIGDLSGLRSTIRRFGVRRVAFESGVSLSMVSQVVNAKRRPGTALEAQLRTAVRDLASGLRKA